MTQQVRDQWVEQAAEMEKSIKRKIEDYEPDAQKRVADVRQPVYEKIGKALNSYAASKGIVIVLDAAVAQQQGFLLRTFYGIISRSGIKYNPQKKHLNGLPLKCLRRPPEPVRTGPPGHPFGRATMLL